MKKKILAVALAAATVLAMAGCSNSDVVSDVDAITNSVDDGSSTNTDNQDNADNQGDADVQNDADNSADSNEQGDLAYIKEKGTLVVGITDFAPMDYKDENGNWIGFDAELATAFAESIGVEVEFVEIDWDNKIMELNGKTVDCIWNGMTLTSEVKDAMECSNAYCINAQVVIVNADVADQYQTTDSLSELAFAVEAGSAGEEQAVEYGFNYTSVESQANALMEVKAGTSDAAIIDNLMAAAMVGEGTSYENLTYTVALNSEEYGVGFRKGSDAAAELNAFFEACLADGSMMSLADKYGVSAMIMQ